MFRMKGEYLVNDRSKVMEVGSLVVNNMKKPVSYRDNDNSGVGLFAKNGQIWQQWDVVYADEWASYGKGDLNTEFGLYVERDFQIVTQLRSNRYLTVINNRQMVIKTPNGSKSQIWYFDQNTLTIKTRINNQSWDIKSSGRTRDMQIWSTNGGWW